MGPWVVSWQEGHLLEGEIIFILVTFLSTISIGRSNSSIMHRGMAPPHGCKQGEGLDVRRRKLESDSKSGGVGKIDPLATFSPLNRSAIR